MNPVIDQFKSISTIVLDVDGVLTDGTVLVLENGLQARRMSIKDGYALQLAVKKGYNLLVVSGAAASPVTDRLAKLGISDVHMGVVDKKQFVLEYMSQRQLRKEEVLFMGDDMPDLEVMQSVGLAACPADAAEEIKQLSHYISSLPGGQGCVRQVIELILKQRGDWSGSEGVTSR